MRSHGLMRSVCRTHGSCVMIQSFMACCTACCTASCTEPLKRFRNISQLPVISVVPPMCSNDATRQNGGVYRQGDPASLQDIVKRQNGGVYRPARHLLITQSVKGAYRSPFVGQRGWPKCGLSATRQNGGVYRPARHLSTSGKAETQDNPLGYFGLFWVVLGC